jgi:preprotein translocase subunit YajC
MRPGNVAIGPTAAIVRADFRAQSALIDQAGACERDPGGPMLFTPAYAQFGSLGAGGANSMIIQFMPLILIIVIMYFLILRPQQRKVKTHQEMVKALRRGDTVITNGGLIGKVTKVVDDNQIEIEISEGVRVRHLRSSVSEVRAKSEPVKEDSTS